MIGDIVIIPTTPPHLGSVTNATEAICEDGVLRPFPADCVTAYTALDLIKELERGVLKHVSG